MQIFLILTRMVTFEQAIGVVRSVNMAFSSLKGGLPADDMGVGKTITAYSSIEFYVQRLLNAPLKSIAVGFRPVLVLFPASA
jgi:SNF2 family DNA or RNA helicase